MPSLIRYLHKYIFTVIMICIGASLSGQQNDTIRIIRKHVITDTTIVNISQPVYDTVYLSPFPESLAVSVIIGGGLGVNRFAPAPDSDASTMLRNTMGRPLQLRGGIHLTAGYKRMSVETGLEFSQISQSFRFSRTLSTNDTLWYYTYENHTMTYYDTIWQDTLTDFEIDTITVTWTDSVPNDSIVTHSSDTVLNHQNQYRQIKIPVLFGFTLFETRRFSATITAGPVFGFFVENNAYTLSGELMPVRTTAPKGLIPYAYLSAGIEYKFAPGFGLGCGAYYNFLLKKPETSTDAFLQNSDNYGITFQFYYYF